MKNSRLFVLLMPMLLLSACVGEPAPVPAQPPGVNAPINAARASANGIEVEARLIDSLTLADAMARRYGITRKENGWLLLITLRDARAKTGQSTRLDSVQLAARAGDLTDAMAPLELRKINVDGYTDYLGSVEAKPPATLRIEIDAVHEGARAELRFSRDLPQL